MDQVNGALAENLKRLRQERGLSLDGLAKLTGVSKSMLGQIERGEANPTVSTVWKIANGLRLPFGELLTRPELECEVVELEKLCPLTEDGGRYRNYPVFPFEAGRRFEMLYIELDPGSCLQAEPHPPGTQEFLTVFSGGLVVETGGETVTAGEGVSLRFRADRPHCYKNSGEALCRLSMVIYYPSFDGK